MYIQVTVHYFAQAGSQSPSRRARTGRRGILELVIVEILMRRERGLSESSDPIIASNIDRPVRSSATKKRPAGYPTRRYDCAR